MRVLGCTLTLCAVLFVAASRLPGLGKEEIPPSQKKIALQDKLVGTWEATKGQLPPGSTIEFAKSGKLKLTVRGEDKQTTVEEGTYKVEGDTLTATLKAEPRDVTETLKIKTLTDTKLVTQDEEGKLDEFKRKK